MHHVLAFEFQNRHSPPVAVTARRNVARPGSQLDNSMAAPSGFIVRFELHEGTGATHVPEQIDVWNPEKCKDNASAAGCTTYRQMSKCRLY